MLDSFFLSFFYPHPMIFFPLLIESEEEKEGGREKNISAREKHQLVIGS